MDFSGKCIIFVLAKRREPQTNGLSPLFLRKNLTVKSYSTSEIEKILSEIEIFLEVSGNFLGELVASIADEEQQRVKIHLFSQDAFLTFAVTTQVKVVRSCHKKLWPLIKQKPKKTLALDAKCLWRDI